MLNTIILFVLLLFLILFIIVGRLSILQIKEIQRKFKRM